MAGSAAHSVMAFILIVCACSSDELAGVELVPRDVLVHVPANGFELLEEFRIEHRGPCKPAEFSRCARDSGAERRPRTVASARRSARYAAEPPRMHVRHRRVIRAAAPAYSGKADQTSDVRSQISSRGAELRRRPAASVEVRRAAERRGRTGFRRGAGRPCRLKSPEGSPPPSSLPRSSGGARRHSSSGGGPPTAGPLSAGAAAAAAAMKRVAVIGSGIAGLARRARLAGHARVTLFEAADYFGGHTHTVDVTLDGMTHGVDTGFLVFNERTYPKLIALFAELGVETAPSEMSFSVQVRRGRHRMERLQPRHRLRPARQPAAAGVLAHARRHPALQPRSPPRWPRRRRRRAARRSTIGRRLPRRAPLLEAAFATGISCR